MTSHRAALQRSRPCAYGRVVSHSCTRTSQTITSEGSRCHSALPRDALGSTSTSSLGSLRRATGRSRGRSEEHTSELQSRPHLVCRLLLEKKKTQSHHPPLYIKKQKQ